MRRHRRCAGRPRFRDLPRTIGRELDLIWAATNGRTLAAVMGPDLVAVTAFPIPVLIELGCVLDFVLAPVDVDLLVISINALDHARRQHHFLPEDPRPGVDDDVARPEFVGRLVNLPDSSVSG